MSETFKAPTLPVLPTSPHKIGLVAEQVEGPVEGAIDDVEVIEVEAEKQSKISIQAPVLHYEPPPWACEPDPADKFQFEIMKEGKIIGHFDLSNRKHGSFVVIGRIKEGCDLLMEHPSISRYHCIMQYGDDRMSKSGKGWHVFELGSTHGTKMNKNRLPPKQYIRTRVGFLFQFGESTRMLCLQGPETDCEPEWDCSPTEMKLKKHKRILEAKLKAAAAKEVEVESKKEEEEEGCGWGMDYGGEDDKGFTLPSDNADAHLMEDREAYYSQDPKKALMKFFEREGFEMKFEFGEQGQGHTHKWVCSIELPVEIDGVDRAFTASATVSTSKKDAQTQCALEACKILDTYNVLRKSNTKMRMKRKTLEENDYYDEDDDLYFDRTGQLEAQREKRKLWAEEGTGPKREAKDTYESLCAKLEQTKKELEECQKHLDHLAGKKKEQKVGEDEDQLDDYMRQLERNGTGTDDAKTKTEKSKWRQRLVAATHEMQKLEKLVKIAKPVEMSGLKALSATSGDKQAFLRKMLAAKKAKNAEKPVEKGVEEPPRKVAKIEENVEQPVIEEGTSKQEEKEEAIEESSDEPEKSELQRKVAEWENELKAEKERAEIEKRKKASAEIARKRRQIEHIERKMVDEGKTEEYGAGCDERDEKYATWIPPAEDCEEKQAALRAKFAGKY